MQIYSEQIIYLDMLIEKMNRWAKCCYGNSDARKIAVNNLTRLREKRGKLLNRYIREHDEHLDTVTLTYLANGEVCYNPPGFGRV